jgi:peptidoglycan/LPS O-acetylase OafA/YrhL
VNHALTAPVGVARVVGVLIVVALLANLSFRFIEQPMIARGHALGRRLERRGGERSAGHGTRVAAESVAG